MNIFILFVGDYEQRSTHSAHSMREEAEAVWLRVSRDYRGSVKRAADIEEIELDQPLCKECGWCEGLHNEHPDTWKHAFTLVAPPGNGRDSLNE